jgi:hypothetical protein
VSEGDEQGHNQGIEDTAGELHFVTVLMGAMNGQFGLLYELPLQFTRKIKLIPKFVKVNILN